MKDGHYAEMRDMDVLRDRLDILNSMEPYIGDWFSKGGPAFKLVSNRC